MLILSTAVISYFYIKELRYGVKYIDLVSVTFITFLIYIIFITFVYLYFERIAWDPNFWINKANLPMTNDLNNIPKAKIAAKGVLNYMLRNNAYFYYDLQDVIFISNRKYFLHARFYYIICILAPLFWYTLTYFILKF